jgi:nondiscriminating glutamyl-tRNA synthetase
MQRKIKSVRVRFAPSPTGFVHVGSLRTALYNYLFARKHDGIFVLRIEDTDRERFTEGAVENLLQTLQWTGLEYDEGPQKDGPFGPYFQSERREIYREHADILVEGGQAYRCFCSEERLEQIRAGQIARKETPRYDGKCRSLSPSESADRAKSEAHVIRMKIPQKGQTVVDDRIRGEVTFQNSVLDDQVLVKSDGYPTYHLANVVDDHLMQISHVIRGEEWMLSTPKHVLLYDFFGWPQPQFAHLPLLLNPDRSKLSKRQGDVAVEDYRKKGYLPQALVNFVALLGWSRGDDQELFSMDDLISSFDLDRVNKSGAVFNHEKLDWMNGIYIRNMDESGYVRQAVAALKEAGLDAGDEQKNRLIALSLRAGINRFGDLPDRAGLYFQDSISGYTNDAQEWLRRKESRFVLAALRDELVRYQRIDLDSFRSIMKTVQEKTGIKGKELWMPVRSAMTGMTEGPELPQVIEILGRDKMIHFIQQVLS